MIFFAFLREGKIVDGEVWIEPEKEVGSKANPPTSLDFK
jgi:hypothetical protein